MLAIAILLALAFSYCCTNSATIDHQWPLSNCHLYRKIALTMCDSSNNQPVYGVDYLLVILNVVWWEHCCRCECPTNSCFSMEVEGPQWRLSTGDFIFLITCQWWRAESEHTHVPILLINQRETEHKRLSVSLEEAVTNPARTPHKGPAVSPYRNSRSLYLC